MHEQVDHSIGAGLEMGWARGERICNRTAGGLRHSHRSFVLEHPTGSQGPKAAARAQEKLAPRHRR
jgi:hypothetical protein